MNAAVPGPDVQGIGDFEIRRTIGEGGTSVVYHAVNTLVGADVALKVLRGRLSDDQRRRFLAECRAQWELGEHPHVVRLYWAGAPESGSAWLAVERYETSLAERLREDRPLATGELDQIADDLLSGLAAVHHAGLVHRDVKPANVMLSGTRAALGDFGLAMLVEDSTRDGGAGTARFIAPEVAAGGAPSWRSDVYSAAVTIRTMYGDALPAPIDAVLTRASSFAPHDRPADAWSLLGALRAARAGRRTSVSAPSGTAAFPAAAPPPAAATEGLEPPSRTHPVIDPGMNTDPGTPAPPVPARRRTAALRWSARVVVLTAAAAGAGSMYLLTAMQDSTGEAAPGPTPGSTPGPAKTSAATVPTGSERTGQLTVIHDTCPPARGLPVVPQFVSSSSQRRLQIRSAPISPGASGIVTLPPGRYTLSLLVTTVDGEDSIGYIDVTVRPGEVGTTKSALICGARGVPLTAADRATSAPS